MVPAVINIKGVDASEAMADMDNNIAYALTLTNLPMDQLGLITYTPWDIPSIVSMLEYKLSETRTYKETVFGFAKMNPEQYEGFFSKDLLKEISNGTGVVSVKENGGELASWAALLSSNVRNVPILSRILQEASHTAADDLGIASIRELDFEDVKAKSTIDGGENGDVVVASLVGLADKRSKALEKRAQVLERGCFNESPDKLSLSIVTNNDNRAVNLLPNSLEELENLTSVSIAQLSMGEDE